MGTLGFNPDTMELVGDAADQTRHALEEANCSFENVVKTTILMQDINQLLAINDVYAEFFPHNQPARIAFQVAALPKGALVEIEAIAKVTGVAEVAEVKKNSGSSNKVWNPREPY